jgi:hypothetical protein
MQQVARLKLYPIAPEDIGSELAQKTDMLRKIEFTGKSPAPPG